YAVTFMGESHIIGGYYRGGTRQWKIEDRWQEGPIMRASGSVYSIVISQNGKWVMTGDCRGKATVWNATTHEKVHELTEHSSSVFGVDISSDCFCVYSTHNGDVLFDSGQNGSVSSSPVALLAWSSDGQQLFVTKKGKITHLDLSKSLASEWSIHDNQHRVSIASTDRFIACAAGSSVSLWDCVSCKQISPIITHNAEVKCVTFLPSGQYLTCGNGWNITIRDLREILAFSPTVSAHRIPNNQYAAQ
ncbi:hypothetical protein M404DRAFT_158336, partial [Pisolithus tinctorius Marx 270]